jgi:hypothetical protein
MVGAPTNRLPPLNCLSSPLHPLFLSMLKRLALMLPPPATARRPRSLPGPIKGAHTTTGAHRPRLHSPFLPSTLGTLPSLSHFGRRQLPPSPGHLTAFRSRVSSQARSSPLPSTFWLPPASIGEPERHLGCSSGSTRHAPCLVHGAPIVHPVHTTTNPVHVLFPFRNNSYC